MSESPFELEYSKQTFGMTSIELFESIGFLDGPTIGAHVVWPTEKEIAILAERRIGVIHNPSSNMKLASGISPVTDMLNAGVLVGLGTDGAASNNDLDMWEEMPPRGVPAEDRQDGPGSAVREYRSQNGHQRRCRSGRSG